PPKALVPHLCATKLQFKSDSEFFESFFPSNRRRASSLSFLCLRFSAQPRYSSLRPYASPKISSHFHRGMPNNVMSLSSMIDLLMHFVRPEGLLPIIVTPIDVCNRRSG